MLGVFFFIKLIIFFFSMSVIFTYSGLRKYSHHLNFATFSVLQLALLSTAFKRPKVTPGAVSTRLHCEDGALVVTHFIFLFINFFFFFIVTPPSLQWAVLLKFMIGKAEYDATYTMLYSEQFVYY